MRLQTPIDPPDMLMFPWPGLWLQCLDGPVPGSESASPGPVLSSSAPLVTSPFTKLASCGRIVLRSTSHDLIPCRMSSVVTMVMVTSPLIVGVIWSQAWPNSDSFIKCWRAVGWRAPLLRPGRTLLQEVSSRQLAATRHQDQDPPAKRWMKFSSSLHYANSCTRQHSPTSWNSWDFIPKIPCSKY